MAEEHRSDEELLRTIVQSLRAIRDMNILAGFVEWATEAIEFLPFTPEAAEFFRVLLDTADAQDELKGDAYGREQNSEGVDE